MYDVVALGELLIDFTPIHGNSEVVFQQNAGGAPANVLVAAAGFGKRTCLIGKIGNDSFGNFLCREIMNRGVDTCGIVKTNDYNTTLAFVHLAEGGERSFSFYRNPGADMMLHYEEIDVSILGNTRVFHYGSVSMTDEPVRTATFSAVEVAKRSGAIVTFDPNIRLSLWKNVEDAKQVILSAIKMVDILKISLEELTFLTGCNNLKDGLSDLLKQHLVSIVLVTMGSQGCFFYSCEGQQMVPGFNVNPVDTTGAGDGFMGAFIGALLDLEKQPNKLTVDELYTIVRIANASGALATTKKGGIPSIPTRKQIMDYILQN